MEDGLKQGCPLSCVLFILVIDPLLTLLDDLPSVDPRCFADDTAVGTRDVRFLTPVFFMFDEWCSVSGCTVNVKKTKIISTAAHPPNVRSFVPEHWDQIAYADSYVYLGVLFGRNIDVTMVYSAALCKFEARIRSHLHLRGLLNMAARVRMANVYFVSIFSYLNKFFLMSEVTCKRAEDLLKLWITKNRTNLERLAAPPHGAGLANPLRDLGKTNVAALLRRKPAIASPVLSGDFSLLIKDHVYHAALFYHDKVGEHFPPYSEQKASAHAPASP